MQLFNFLTISALAAAASAYQVLTPGANSTLSKGSPFTVKWSSVDTDAETFSIYLVNFQTHHWPPTVLSLAQGLSRDDLSAEITIPCDVSSDYGWQLNFINGTNTYVIYAQSQTFTLTGDCTNPTPSSTAAPFPTGHTNTTTVVAPGATTTKHTVETVIYEKPIVWFVPADGAVCAPYSQQTVTVYRDGPAPTSCGGAPGAPGGGHGVYNNGTVVPTPAPTKPSVGTVSPPSPTGPTEFTGAATSVKVGGASLALLAGAVALLL